jgi:protein-disulfide isomerase
MELNRLAHRPLFAVIAAAAVLGFASVAHARQEPAAAEATQGASAADAEAMRSDIEALKKGQEAIQKTLEEIKTLLRQAPAGQRQGQAAAAGPPNVTIDLAGQPLQGAGEATLTIVEFSDYQCPYCARHTRDTYPKLEKDFISTGKVRYAMLDLPLRNHPFAFKAAEAATCAASEGKFWEMHHLLFENQQALQPETLPAYAEKVGLDRGEFEACLQEGRQESVNADLAQATKAGITATPTFLIGWLRGDQLKPAEVIRGAQPYESFERVLSQLLEQGPPSAAPPSGDGE